MPPKKTLKKDEEVKISLWKKVGQPRQYSWEKDEILEVIYWQKQILSLILGITWGVLKLQYLPVIIAFLVMIGAASYFVGFQILPGDETEGVGGPWPVVTEGGMPAFATFLLAWIITYTMCYY
ncbi:hypothetical protein AKO1_008745 [Acrasis kona]|uniref:Rab5-interacting protein n=1 Tax=Acrasis kona TaxID=1008807 RepID=A0AAW2ZET5_9EUKA